MIIADELLFDNAVTVGDVKPEEGQWEGAPPPHEAVWGGVSCHDRPMTL